MKIYEIATNDKKLKEWDPTIIGWGLDAIKDLTRGVRKKNVDIDDLRKSYDKDKDNSTRTVRKSGGSDEYDHIINRHRNR